MKTYKNLWSQFISFENLYKASIKASKRKRWKENALLFNSNLEENILKLQYELISGKYQPGEYHQFKIYEPKERIISAAPYKDRVVHHAITNIIEPIWESRFYYHSYACRIGKGTHRAIDKCQEYLRKNRYILKCDIKKFFPSIDHLILKNSLKKRIADERLLKIINMIIDSHETDIENSIEYFPDDDLFSPLERKKGIPIGNLTSQYFANIYLHELDKWFKFNKGVACYIRYMDDFIIFHDSKQYLKELKEELKKFLYHLRLILHDKKQQIFPSKNGVLFLGFHIYREKRRLNKENIRRFFQRMKVNQNKFKDGDIDLEKIRQSIVSWIGHTKHGDCYLLRKDIFRRLVFAK